MAGGLLCPCWLDHMRACMFFKACMPIILLVLVQLVLDSAIEASMQPCSMSQHCMLFCSLYLQHWVVLVWYCARPRCLLCLHIIMVACSSHSCCNWLGYMVEAATLDIQTLLECTLYD